MSEVNIGHEPSEFAQRDAIHVAVIPAICDGRGDGRLFAGAEVGVDENGMAYEVADGRGVGIVDPFLLRPVDKGKRFWLFLKPNSITGMRHHWEHPKFPEGREPRPSTTEIDKARVWLAVKMGQVIPYVTFTFPEFCDWLARTYETGHFVDITERREEWSDGSYIYDLIVGIDRPTAIKCLQSVLGREIREKPLDDYGYRCAC